MNLQISKKCKGFQKKVIPIIYKKYLLEPTSNFLYCKIIDIHKLSSPLFSKITNKLLVLWFFNIFWTKSDINMKLGQKTPKKLCNVTLQRYHFVRNVTNCQEFQIFCQKVRKMSRIGELLVMSGKCQEFSIMCLWRYCIFCFSVQCEKNI